MEFRLLERRRQKEAADLLIRNYPDAKYYLTYNDPVGLMVAAMLSAQTRDEVVNSLTPGLFARFKTAEDYAEASPDELLKYMGGVFSAKAKAVRIIGACKILVEKYKGKVPKAMEELTALPGIGRKTANTILINAYGIADGIPVDTWVIRLSGRIGLSKEKDPDKIERDLMELVDKKHWHNIAYVMKAHGRKTCQARTPECSACFLSKLCPRNGVTQSR